MKITGLVVAALLMAFGAACSDDDDSGGEATSAAPAATTGAAGTPPSGGICAANLASAAAPGDLTWAAALPDPIPAPEGFTIQDPEGDGPLVNVLRDGQVVGTLELSQFPLDAAFNSAQGLEALGAWAEGFYDPVSADRQAAIPGIVFTADDPESDAFGSFCGISYGYSVIDPADEAANELFLGHATFDSTKLYLVTASYNEATPGSGFVDEATLQAFAEGFQNLVAALKIPVQ